MTIYGDATKPQPLSRRRIAGAAAGTLLSLAVASLAIWQIDLHGAHGDSLASAPRRPASITRQRNDAPQAGTGGNGLAAATAPASIAGGTASRPATGPQLILVDSAAQAAAAMQAIDQAEPLRLQLGLPAVEYQILVVSGDADVEAALKAAADENTTRTALGLPEIQVVDLRAATQTSGR